MSVIGSITHPNRTEPVLDFWVDVGTRYWMKLLVWVITPTNLVSITAECVYALKGLGLPQACNAGNVGLSGRSRWATRASRLSACAHSAVEIFVELSLLICFHESMFRWMPCVRTKLIVFGRMPCHEPCC